LSDELVVVTRTGRASLPSWRVVNGEETTAFFLAHAPEVR
jgi:hypothetical protein